MANNEEREDFIIFLLDNAKIPQINKFAHHNN